MLLADRQLFPSVSVGITLNHDTHESAEDLLREAHVAVHRAKQGGRHRFEIFDAALHQQVVHQLDLEGELRNALQNGEFEPYFQPIVRLEDGAIVGHESLLRWHHPRRGLLAPGAFLAVAEESGCIAQIDWQIFERTCAMLACQPQGGRLLHHQRVAPALPLAEAGAAAAGDDRKARGRAAAPSRGDHRERGARRSRSGAAHPERPA